MKIYRILLGKFKKTTQFRNSSTLPFNERHTDEGNGEEQTSSESVQKRYRTVSLSSQLREFQARQSGWFEADPPVWKEEGLPVSRWNGALSLSLPPSSSQTLDIFVSSHGGSLSRCFKGNIILTCPFRSPPVGLMEVEHILGME